LACTALAGGVLGALAGAAAGWSALLPALVVLALASTPLVLIDYEHHRLPDRLIRPAAGAGTVLLVLAASVRHDWHALLRAGEGAAAVFAVLFVLMFISPRSFGFGDVKLGAVLGGYLGWFGWAYVYYGIFAGFLLGSVLSIALIATRRATLKSAIAFGPMLILGALLVLAFRIAPSFGSS
jgi:leader peptidase (prepilin peptidase)/N-methyltransferase